ncbi:MAG: hypothetical protein IJC80_04270 [Clostridia bacterium]|nr:hypothetical protein [Clostridia bacterium]
MNKTDVPTYQKIMLPVRLSPELYYQMMEKIHDKKRDERGYSINQYLTELIAKDLKR